MACPKLPNNATGELVLMMHAATGSPPTERAFPHAEVSCVGAKWLLRWALLMVSYSCSLMSGMLRSRTIPALLKRMSAPPQLPVAAWTKTAGAIPVSDVVAVRHGLAADLADPLRRPRQRRIRATAVYRTAEAVDDDARTLICEQCGVLTPDASTSGRDDGNATLEHFHKPSPATSDRTQC